MPSLEDVESGVALNKKEIEGIRDRISALTSRIDAISPSLKVILSRNSPHHVSPSLKLRLATGQGWSGQEERQGEELIQKLTDSFVEKVDIAL